LILDSIIESFNWHNLSGCNMALGDSASNRNEYQEYLPGDKSCQCIRLTTSPPSWAYCHEIWEPRSPGSIRASPALYRDCSTFLLFYVEWIGHKKNIVHYNKWLCYTTNSE